jgi:hypothetical protein
MHSALLELSHCPEVGWSNISRQHARYSQSGVWFSTLVRSMSVAGYIGDAKRLNASAPANTVAGRLKSICLSATLACMGCGGPGRKPLSLHGIFDWCQLVLISIRVGDGLNSFVHVGDGRFFEDKSLCVARVDENVLLVGRKRILRIRTSPIAILLVEILEESWLGAMV